MPVCETVAISLTGRSFQFPLNSNTLKVQNFLEISKRKQTVFHCCYLFQLKNLQNLTDTSGLWPLQQSHWRFLLQSRNKQKFTIYLVTTLQEWNSIRYPAEREREGDDGENQRGSIGEVNKAIASLVRQTWEFDRRGFARLGRPGSGWWGRGRAARGTTVGKTGVAERESKQCRS